MMELLTLGFRTRNWPEALNPHITAPDSHTLLTQTFVNMATYQKVPTNPKTPYVEVPDQSDL